MNAVSGHLGGRCGCRKKKKKARNAKKANQIGSWNPKKPRRPKNPSQPNDLRSDLMLSFLAEGGPPALGAKVPIGGHGRGSTAAKYFAGLGQAIGTTPEATQRDLWTQRVASSIATPTRPRRHTIARAFDLDVTIL